LGQENGRFFKNSDMNPSTIKNFPCHIFLKFSVPPYRAAIFKPTRQAGRSFSAFTKPVSDGNKGLGLEDEFLD
jgi:hypothetical protein